MLLQEPARKAALNDASSSPLLFLSPSGLISALIHLLLGFSTISRTFDLTCSTCCLLCVRALSSRRCIVDVLPSVERTMENVVGVRRPQQHRWSETGRGLFSPLLLGAFVPFAPVLVVQLVLLPRGCVNASSGRDVEPAPDASCSTMHFILASDMASAEQLDPTARASSSSSMRTESASMEFMSARDFAISVGHRSDARLPARSRGITGRPVREVNYHGWVNSPGPGRVKGSAVKVRERVRDVLTVVLCTELNRNLTKHFTDGGIATRALLGLRPRRHSLKSVTDKLLRQRAWWLGRSLYFGVLMHMGDSRSRLDKHRLPTYAINVTPGITGRLQVSFRGPEKCQDKNGCDFGADMAAALEAVRAASALSMGD